MVEKYYYLRKNVLLCVDFIDGNFGFNINEE